MTRAELGWATAPVVVAQAACSVAWAFRLRRHKRVPVAVRVATVGLALVAALLSAVANFWWLAGVCGSLAAMSVVYARDYPRYAAALSRVTAARREHERECPPFFVAATRPALGLSDAERVEGFVRPLRTAYWHTTCGKVTAVDWAIAAAFARDPHFFGGTYCAHCRARRPVGEFRWVDPAHPERQSSTLDPKVGT